MKKFALLLSLSLLASCSYSNNSINFLPFRNKIFTIWQTDSIFYYDKAYSEEFLAESKTTTEEKLERGQVLITHAGDEMISSRIYHTDYYSTETVKPTKNGEMDSAYSPIKIRKNADYTAFGEVRHDGERYMLVRQGKSDDIILVNGDGEIYEHIGRMVDGRLAVLSAKFYISPKDLKMIPVVNTRVETSEETSSYRLTYDGLANDGYDMVFTYEEDGFEPEEIRFSVCDEHIDIHGIQIDIFDVNENKIEYMIK